MQGQNPVREDIGKLNEDISTFKQEIMVRTFIFTLTHPKCLADLKIDHFNCQP